MTDSLTITGLVATTPRHLVTSEGLPVTSFRLASSLRRFDQSKKTWVEYGTNWYTVTSYRQLATNTVGSVQKGDRVIVSGRLRIRDWESGEKRGTNVEIDADALGHDLSWGKSVFSRSVHAIAISEDAASETAEDNPEETQETEALDAGELSPEKELETVSVPF
ncbi:MAG: single-stranded DNA-binding protein [Cryobacterium sp.]|nr:single-stranded DNA-binding protein [Cryobacterium sp.]MCC7128548.1 single-stranded DNA-binding protein [Microbacteriaceae bacterium]MCO5294323.1 single-stranded DNA-binding protein [Homoserinimonas sp.]MBX3089113.1 single-stranded DNA-binding protein [Cryobacterium sp.]MBX3117246.1 single-stranded DNA-binding protein [Cryobacterium sp.]